MKKISFIIILFCLTFSSGIHAQWQTITVPVAGQDIFGISFINDTTAYVSSDHDLVFTQNNFSTFSGTPWSVYLLGQLVPFIREDNREIRFTSASNGLLTGAFNTFNDYAILQTTDGAATWNIIFTDNGGAVIRFIAAMDFNSGIGLACGAHGHLIRSADDGNTWNFVTSPTTGDMLEVQFTNPLSAIAVGENSLLRTGDAGISWSRDTSFNSKFLYSLAVANNGSHVYTASEDEIFYSLNGGATFTAVTPPFTQINCLAAQGADTLLAGTANGIYLSKDHGMHWSQFSQTQSYSINRIVIQHNVAYALCNTGIMLRSALSNLIPEPIAAFTSAQNETCGQTSVNISSASDPSYTYSWYVNGVLQSTSNSGFSFNRNTSVSDSISMVAGNGITTDTAIEVLNVHVRQYAANTATPDQSGCYGQNFVIDVQVTPGQTYQYSFDNSPLAGFGSTIVLADVTANGIVVIEANTTDDCPVYDTLGISVSGQIIEPFLPVISTQLIGGNWRFASADAPSDTVVYALLEDGNFFKSVDKGVTWTKTNITSNITRYNFIDFVNDTLGYIPDVNFKTTNGGQTFTVIPAMQNNTGDAGIVSFLNTTTGVIAIQPDNWNASHWKIFETLDGGQTFNQSHYNDSLSFWISDVAMLTSSTFFVSGGVSLQGSVPYIKKTTDGGLTWTSLAVPGNKSIMSIDVLSEDTIFAMGQDDFVYRTYDGGATWNTFLLGNNNCACESGIKMLNAQTGYLFRGTGDVYKTENGGECWTKVWALNDVYLSRISVSPSGSEVYISGKNIYHFHTGRNLSVSIDSGYCVNTPIYTHNFSSGYSGYTWKLDGQIYSSTRDTVFRFASTGSHTITLYADSSGIPVDTIQYTINILPSIGSVGTITGPLTACTMQSTTLYQFIAGSNALVTQYHWWTNNQALVLSNLNNETDSSLEVYFNANPNYSSFITLYASGYGATGCYTSDTASFLLHLVHTTPGQPVVTANISDCYSIPEDSLSSPFPFDSIFCSINRDPLAEFFRFGNTDAVDTFGYVPFYPECPGNSYIMVSEGNSCGFSTTTIPIHTFLVPDNVVHTPDTVVTSGADVQFYFRPYSNPDVLMNCGLPNNYWITPSGNTAITTTDYYEVFGFSAIDTGYYTAYRVFECDTVFATFHAGFNGGVSVQQLSGEEIYLTATQHENIIHASFKNLLEDAVLNLFDITGRRIRNLQLKSGTTTAGLGSEDLSKGIYQLQLMTSFGQQTIKLIIQ